MIDMLDESSEEAYLKNISSYKKQTGIMSVFCAIGGFLGKTQVAFLAGLSTYYGLYAAKHCLGNTL
jgi:hypothetical protein